MYAEAMRMHGLRFFVSERLLPCCQFRGQGLLQTVLHRIQDGIAKGIGFGVVSAEEQDKIISIIHSHYPTV